MEAVSSAILCGDALEVLRGLESNSVDAMVTDPPAGIAFMGKSWDRDKGGRDAWIAWLAEIMREALRVVKPGGHALVWALPRTSHLTGMALEDAGWEVRDRVTHITGQGFPKSLSISLAIDKLAGANRAKTKPVAVPRRNRNGTNALGGGWQDEPWETAPATDAAKQWDGWGTALKPAAEDWWLCRKPIAESSIAANVLAWGTGGLNIAATRINPGEHVPGGGTYGGVFGNGKPANHLRQDLGRWPANLVLDEAAAALLDAQSGVTKSGMMRAGTHRQAASMYGQGSGWDVGRDTYGDTGGASRFFYIAKASRAERDAGCEALPLKSMDVFGDDEWGKRERANVQPAHNGHPTVKSLSLMRWLVRLITAPGQHVLDPFGGSGSTAVACIEEGREYTIIEREAEYISIIQARTAHAAKAIERPVAPPTPRRASNPTPRPNTATPVALWPEMALEEAV